MSPARVVDVLDRGASARAVPEARGSAVNTQSREAWTAGHYVSDSTLLLPRSVECQAGSKCTHGYSASELCPLCKRAQ